MSRALQAVGTALLLVAALPAPSQDRVSLDGEQALRFLAGHDHGFTFCDGVLYVTPTRVRYLTGFQDHSFDWQKSQVTEFKTGRALGYDYVKMQAGGKSYRLGVYPTLGNPFGDRYKLLVRAFEDFQGTSAEIERVARERNAGPPRAALTRAAAGPVLRFPVAAFLGDAYFKPNPLFKGGRDYSVSMANSWGWLEITAERIRFLSQSGPELRIDSLKSDWSEAAAAVGYPRVILWNAAERKRYSFVHAERKGDSIVYYDSAEILEALGPGFSELVSRLLPKPSLAIVSRPAGAEVYLNDERRGSTGPEGALKVPELPPGDYRVRATLKGYEDWSQEVRLRPGDEAKLEAALVALPPPPPPQPAGPQPFTAQDVVELLQGGVSPKRVATLVQERGVDFPLTDPVEKQIRAAGGDAELLVVIAKARK
ncbi:MAG: PEGA domain-containing protein [Acidobacteriota bacterium]|nr:PEGA domain-containing protein [Acidobacteriota bacterium]